MADGDTQEEARLYETQGNPAPVDFYTGFVETTDGVFIRYARWDATARPVKGTILLLQGRTECIEKYFETIEDLRNRGFAVLSFDWRGQGGSTRLLRDRKKGHVENFNQYLLDYEAVLSKVALPDCPSPLYAVGHSTGALVALMAAPALANRIRRMVLLSPLLKLTDIPIKQSTLQKVLGVLAFLGLGRAYLAQNRSPERFKTFVSNKLTSDTRRFQRNRNIVEHHKHLDISYPTIAWVFAACRAMQRVDELGFANSIAIPTLFVAAGSDRVVSPQAVERYGTAMRSGSFLTISGARHEILQERDEFREQFFAAFDAFIPGTGS